MRRVLRLLPVLWSKLEPMNVTRPVYTEVFIESENRANFQSFCNNYD